jgi:hypothetical protein
VARAQIALNLLPDAEISLAKALVDDPNNMPALLQLMRLHEQTGDTAKAEETARRLVAVESKPYMLLRALPEIVPTETFEARVYLSQQEHDPGRQAELLRPAMDGWLSYLRLTLPGIRESAAAGVPSPSGATLPEAKKNIQSGLEAAQRLSAIYRAMGRAADGEAAEAAAKEFSKALGTL